MSITLGIDNPSDFYLGSSPVSELYLGSNLVWPIPAGPTASFFYSTRPYTPGYAGSALRINNGTSDLVVNYLNGNLDQQAIISHAITSSQKVNRWVNQITGSISLSAVTSSSPYMYLSNKVTKLLSNNRPAIDWGGGNFTLSTGGSAYNIIPPRSFFFVVSINSPGSIYSPIFSSGGHTVYIRKNGASGPLVFNAGGTAVDIHPDYDAMVGGNYLISVFQDASGNTETYLNGALAGTGNAGINNMSGSTGLGEISVGGNFYYADISIAEFALYNKDVRADRITIENAMNSYFGIY